jgi:acyl carrier protein
MQSAALPIRSRIESMLAERGVGAAVGDHDSLFVSGLLDSVAATQLLLALESDYGVDLSDADFDISRLDTVAELEAMLAARN